MSVIKQVQKINAWDVHVYIWKLIQFLFTFKLCVSFFLLSVLIQIKINDFEKKMQYRFVAGFLKKSNIK